LLPTQAGRLCYFKTSRHATSCRFVLDEISSASKMLALLQHHLQDNFSTARIGAGFRLRASQLRRTRKTCTTNFIPPNAQRLLLKQRALNPPASNEGYNFGILHKLNVLPKKAALDIN